MSFYEYSKGVSLKILSVLNILCRTIKTQEIVTVHDLVQILTSLQRIQTFYIRISLQKFALLTNIKGNG
ncbi:hypothetical protein EG339_11015 [Chryseobacterium bernardetii]|jgi:hypothetical protein|uniref:Uncharacterized protein n=1 Tax=Chryseobacterium bernardetii TaxID=1241978 RepID=A0A3G6TG82_9FLAO|nr:hypothetical protein EG339_11015 [Chryseobacterium bernardetii]AZB35621.1 hypothetical protein EG351_19865 [Chryseobacterium bernardetii]